MRADGGLRILANVLKTWWPGTELNRRRQPFQGCALPPELPGHFLRTFCLHALSTKGLTAVFAVHWALSLGGMAAKQNSRCAGNRAELSNYSNLATFLKIVADDFSLPLFLLTFFCHILFHARSHDERWPLGTPFMTVSAQRLAPNQYGISR